MIYFLKKLGIAVLILLAITEISYATHQNINWSFPVNYSSLLEKAQANDHSAQEEISSIIYKGIMRYPSEDNKYDSIVFSWLSVINKDDSFERKVARLFFTHGTASDSQDTYNLIKTKAETGNMFAQRTMGSLHFYTKLVESSPKEGLMWYRKAAYQGHARAQLSLGLRFILGGYNLKKNTEKGLKFIQIASYFGLPEALYTLGNRYIEGKNVPRNHELGCKYLMLAANAGNTDAQLELACFHLGFLDVQFPISPSVELGLYWLEKASDNGNLDAMLMYANIYLQGILVPRDTEKGLQFMKRASELGNSKASAIYQNLISPNE